MLVAKEAEIQKRTMEGGNSVDSCLWTTIPVQFVPVEACDEAMKWDRKLQPAKTILDCRYSARVSGRWPPLVSLRPRGALTDKLEWTDPAVDQEPRRLFKSDNPGSLKRFFDRLRRELERDAVQPLTRNLSLIGL